MTALGQVREDASTITAKLSKAHYLDVSPVLALIGYPCDRGDNSGSEFMVRFPFALVRGRAKDRLTRGHALLTRNPSATSAFQTTRTCNIHVEILATDTEIGTHGAAPDDPSIAVRRRRNTPATHIQHSGRQHNSGGGTTTAAGHSKCGKPEGSAHTHGHARLPQLSDVRFRGRSVRQVSCYTLLSGCQLPWPPSCCQYRSTPFRFLICRQPWSPTASSRFNPTRQFCLPKVAHTGGDNVRGVYFKFENPAPTIGT